MLLPLLLLFLPHCCVVSVVVVGVVSGGVDGDNGGGLNVLTLTLFWLHFGL